MVKRTVKGVPTSLQSSVRPHGREGQRGVTRGNPKAAFGCDGLRFGLGLG